MRCKSVTPDNDSKAQYIMAEALNKMGFECKIIEFNNPVGGEPVRNLFASLGKDNTGKNNPSFAFCGHIDVVKADEPDWIADPWGAEILDKDGNKVLEKDTSKLKGSDLIYGRGAEDMKSGSAAFIAAISKNLKTVGGKTENFPGRIGLIINGAEENSAVNGMEMFARYLAETEEPFDAILTGEPTSKEKSGDRYRPGRRGRINEEISAEDTETLFKIVDDLDKTLIDNGTESGYPPTDTIPTGISGGYMFEKDKNKDKKTLSKEADTAGYVNVTIGVVGKEGHTAFKELSNNAFPHLADMVSKLKKEAGAEFI